MPHMCLALLQFSLFFPACSSFGQKKPPENQPGIAGKIIGKSDVMGQPDYPLRGVVFMVAPEKMKTLLAQIGAEAKYTLHPMLSYSFTEESFQQFARSHALAETNGNYYLEVPPGDWWLCLGNIGTSQTALTFPIELNGCGLVKVEAGKPLNKDITWGEGGFGLK